MHDSAPEALGSGWSGERQHSRPIAASQEKGCESLFWKYTLPAEADRTSEVSSSAVYLTEELTEGIGGQRRARPQNS